MTDAELRDAAIEFSSAYPGEDRRAIGAALVEEVSRLRGVILAAEWQNDEYGRSCPFCHKSEEPYQGWPGGHASDCPAFSARGVLR